MTRRVVGTPARITAGRSRAEGRVADNVRHGGGRDATHAYDRPDDPLPLPLEESPRFPAGEAVTGRRGVRIAREPARGRGPRSARGPSGDYRDACIRG